MVRESDPPTDPTDHVLLVVYERRVIAEAVITVSLGNVWLPHVT